VRKYSLDSILSLPQLVVYGDQSASKSSVLEALTEILFPRNDNLCTRYATEIELRRGDVNTLTIKVIPDDNRPAAEKEVIKAFHETISDFGQLLKVMKLATIAIGISDTETSDSEARAFARDVLSI
jgi:GTPase SAR1 family protein